MAQIWNAVCELISGNCDEEVIRSSGPLQLCCDNDDLNLYFYINNSLAFRIFQLSRFLERDALDLYCIFERTLPALHDAMSCRYSNVETFKEMCLIIKNNISYSPAHVAAHANILGVYSHKDIQPHINTSCDAVYPIHVALGLESNSVLIELIKCGANILCLDEKHNNAVHLAVNLEDESFLCAICQYADPDVLTKALSALNKMGETPLHIVSKFNAALQCAVLLDRGATPAAFGAAGTPVHYACKYESTDVLKLLLREDPSVVDEVCEKYGSIPMHWCKCSTEAELLLQAKSLLNYESKTGHHPIHVMAEYGRVGMVIFLITNNVCVDLVGPGGNTALHFAACEGHEYVMKALLAIGADTTIKNTDSLTAYKLARVSNSKCEMSSVLNVLSENHECTTNDGLGYINQSTNRDCFTASVIPGRTLLSLDGGGIRSIILCKILMQIEKISKRPVVNLFDWITGTGFGAHVALALCQGISAKSCLFMYFQMKNLIFDGERPYNSAVLDCFLKELYSEEITMMTMRDKPKMLIPVTLADRIPARLRMFRNYQRDIEEEIQWFHKNVTKAEEKDLRSRISEEYDIPVWKVARYSFSSPTYFPPKDNYLDGSIVSNNPTLDAIVEINNVNNELNESGPPVGLVLSLGTGRQTTTKVKNPALKALGSNQCDLPTPLTRLQLQEIVMAGVYERNAHVVDRAKSWCDTIGAFYFRLDPCLAEDVAFDETDNNVLVDMLWTTHLYLLNNEHTIKDIVCSLDS